jgi:hypothetical protein
VAVPGGFRFASPSPSFHPATGSLLDPDCC